LKEIIHLNGGRFSNRIENTIKKVNQCDVVREIQNSETEAVDNSLVIPSLDNQKTQVTILFNDLSNFFDLVYDRGIETQNTSNSMKFNHLVKDAEIALNFAKSINKLLQNDPDSEDSKKLSKMEIKFDELYQLIPLGPCVFLTARCR